MVGAVRESRLHPHDRESGNGPLAQTGAEALLHRRDIFLWHASTDDSVFKNKCLGGIIRQRVESADDVGKLPRTARLLLVLVLVLGGSGGSLAITHLGRTNLNLNLKLPLDALHVNIQMQLAHPSDQRFTCFLVGGHAKRRVFAGETLQGLAQAVEAVSVGWRDRHFDDRLGDKHAFQRAVFLLGGVGIAAGSINANNSHDVSGFGNVDFSPLVGVHFHDSTEPLLLAGALVNVGLALGDRALIEPHECQLPVGVIDDFKCHCHEWLLGNRL